MKKKKQDNFTWGDWVFVFTIILIISIFFSCIFYGIYSFYKPNYKITINECHNETISEFSKCVATCELNIDGSINLSMCYNYSCFADIKTYSKEVCEDREVDSLCSDLCFAGKIRECEPIAGYNKIDITKEWLNENCECLWKVCKGYGISNSNKKNADVFWCPEKNIKCLKYKCFDKYEVEIK